MAPPDDPVASAARAQLAAAMRMFAGDLMRECYRQGLTREEALEALREGLGGKEGKHNVRSEEEEGQHQDDEVQEA